MTTEASFPARGRIDKAEAVAELRRVQASGEIPRALDSLVAPLAILDAQRAVNMLKNALEASPEGAVVSIGFRRQGEAEFTFSVNNPSFMDRAVQVQVFKRYFSTKGDGRGLGTWGMRLLAEEYLGGHVTFTTSMESGTTFLLTLPLKPREM